MNYLELKALQGSIIRLDYLLEETGSIKTEEEIASNGYVESAYAEARVFIDVIDNCVYDYLNLDSTVKITKVESL